MPEVFGGHERVSESMNGAWRRLPVTLLALVALVGCSGGKVRSSDKGEQIQGEEGTGGATAGTCGGCQIGARCFPEGIENPENACQVCRSNLDAKDWTQRADGFDCDDGLFCTGGDFCQEGVCQGGSKDPCDDGVSCTGTESCDEMTNSCALGAPTCAPGQVCDRDLDTCALTCDGCAIDGVCYPSGVRNPLNECELCDVDQHGFAWVAASEGSACNDGTFCNGEDTCHNGMCKSGKVEPCDDGVDCNGEETCNEDSNTCSPSASTCSPGTSCSLGTNACVITCAGCVVDGICYADGSANPLNACETCNRALNSQAFSTVADGVVCDNGVFCDGTDICQAGTCTAPNLNPCNDGIDCNGSEACDEETTSCEHGTSTCSPGLVCVASTNSCAVTCDGCIVSGTCYARGTPNPENACEACNVAVSRTAFSAVPNGRVCDNSVFCDGADSCQAGICTAPNENPCDDGVACNGTESCSEATDRCGSGSPTCSAGKACSPSTDTCEFTCDGCLVAGVCYANGSANPANRCETCQVSQSTTAFTPEANGTACSDGLFCNGMDTCQAGTCTPAGTNPCGDGISCNGTESCNESTDSCGPGSSTCGAGKYCDVSGDTCTATCNGCSIGGVCYPDGIPNPANACEVCDVEASASAWSTLSNGTACGYNAVCEIGACACSPGWVKIGGYCSMMGIEAADETWPGTVYNGIQAVMPKVNLLSNDVNHIGDHSELVIVSVKSAVNGTVTMNGTNVLFTGSSVGPGSFVYVVQAGSDPNTQVEVKVSFSVVVAPSVIAVSDSRSVQQGDALPITAASLLANDVGTGLTIISVQNPVKGTVSLVGTAITFLSTGLAGEPAEFEYTVQNGSAVQSTGKVYITATPLPGVGGYIYDDFVLFDSKRTTYQPPTVRSIFDTWGRFDGNTYFAPGATLTGTAAAWSLIADEDNDGNIDGDLDGDTIQDNKTFFTSGAYTINGDINGDGIFDARFMQRNNGSYNGFISPLSYENYTHQVTLWSLDADDDMVGVLLAYTSGGGAGTLHVDRTAGGYTPNQGWGLMDGTTVVVNFGVNGVFTNPGTGWGGKASRVKVVRAGDLITVYCTNWMTNAANFFSPPAYNPDSTIEIDLAATTNNIRWSVSGVPQTASRDLTRFRGAHPYGYVNASQALSSYIDVQFDGGIQSNVLVYLKDKQSGVNVWNQSEVWRYLSGSWSMTAESAQDVFGFVRPVTEPETGNVYQIKATEVEKL